MQRVRKTVAIAALGLIAMCALAPQGSAQQAKLESEIPRLMQAAEIPGLSVAVIASGEPAWWKGFGVKNVETGEPVDEFTIFEAASLSKPVVAYAVLRMASRGEFDLDEPLWNTLVYERLEHDERSRELTARMVLTHTTGLPNWGGTPLEFNRDPGDSWGYSGEGFVYLQRTLEKTTGLALNEIVAREVFEPLGMHSSSFVWTDAYDSLSATPHDLLAQATRKGRPDDANGAASLHTTAREYALFVAAVLRGEGLSPELAAAMIAPQVPAGERGDEAAREHVYWGLGIGIQEGTRGRAVWHWGDNGNFRCYVIAYPEDGRGIAYFTNSFNGLSIAEDLISLAVEDTHWVIPWLDYWPYDNPRRLARIQLRRTLLNDGVGEALRVYRQLYSESVEVAEELPNLGSFAVQRGMVEEGLALLRDAVANDPSADNWIALAQAATTAGDYTQALDGYHEALAIDSTRAGDLNPRIAWLEEGIAALEEPVELSAEQLAAYVGVYGPRHIVLREGSLYYRREGATAETRLTPLTRDMFALESNRSFRIRFVADEIGVFVKIVGLYSDGRTDETLRQNP
jgi:CubicO group peptidase (beta-lactamase class C family)